MKKEEIIIQAFRLCEDLKKIGFDSSLSVAVHVNSISINVWDSNDTEMNFLINIYSYLDDDFVNERHFHYKEIIPTLKDFINQHKKVA